MLKHTMTAMLALGLAAAAGPIYAQDTGALPAACQASEGMADHAGMDMDGGGMSMNHEMDEAHTALMAGMDDMNQKMMTGGMVPDIDVAFLCSMIPHYQGAISMAEAELKYGDDEWSKQMAQKIIDAQKQEIAEMTAQIEKLTQ